MKEKATRVPQVKKSCAGSLSTSTQSANQQKQNVANLALPAATTQAAHDKMFPVNVLGTKRVSSFVVVTC